MLRVAGVPFRKALGAEHETAAPRLGEYLLKCFGLMKWGVWTMSTLWASDRVVHGSDWLGFGIYQAVCDSGLVLWLMPAWDGGAGAVGLFRYR